MSFSHGLIAFFSSPGEVELRLPRGWKAQDRNASFCSGQPTQRHKLGPLACLCKLWVSRKIYAQICMNHVPAYSWLCINMHISQHFCLGRSIYEFIYLSGYVFNDLSIYLSPSLSLSPSLCLSLYLSPLSLGIRLSAPDVPNFGPLSVLRAPGCQGPGNRVNPLPKTPWLYSKPKVCL